MSTDQKRKLILWSTLAVILCLVAATVLLLWPEGEPAGNGSTNTSSHPDEGDGQTPASSREPLDARDIENATCYEAVNRSKECYKTLGSDDKEARASFESLIRNNRRSIKTVYSYGGEVYQSFKEASNAAFDDAEQAGTSKSAVVPQYEFHGNLYDEYNAARKDAGQISSAFYFNGDYYDSHSEAEAALERYNSDR